MSIQQEAQAYFEQQGWPHRKMEGWQWSDFAQEMKNSKQDIAQPVQPKISQIEGVQYQDAICARLPQNMDALTALNIAQGAKSSSLAIPAGAEIAEPIHIHHRAGLAQTDITVGEGARAIIYEHIGADGFSHLLTEIKLQPHAQLDHIRIFDQPETALTAARLDVDLAAHAEWRAAIIASGAKLQRIDHRMRFSGPHAHAQCAAALLAGGRAHSDIGMAADHSQPHCRSAAAMRAILSDHARGSFRGTAYVAEGAAGSDVQQLAKTLLLSDLARMNAKPQLNIHNDDVQCAHGVAIGALDEMALFYLRSRAISEKEAKQILITAFISDLFGHIPVAKAIALEKLGQLI